MSRVKTALFKKMSDRKALGNSDRSFKDVASDLLNADGRNRVQYIADGTFLSPSTIVRMMDLSDTESGAPYRPADDTVERILIYYGVGADLFFTNIKAQYQNVPKWGTE